MPRKRKVSKRIQIKVLENINSGFFTLHENYRSGKNANFFRVKCAQSNRENGSCNACNLAVLHSGGSDCTWHPDSDVFELDFINKDNFPEFFI